MHIVIHATNPVISSGDFPDGDVAHVDGDGIQKDSINEWNKPFLLGLVNLIP